jgi:hypothetical protein
MGILDDLKMGLGFEEKTRDYYDRTAKTIERNDGSDAADKYREYIGFTPGGTHTGSYGSAPHYSDTSTGPQVSDFRQGPRPDNIPTPGTFSHSMGQMPGMIGLLARLFNGSGNTPAEQPLLSNAQRRVSPRRRGATQAAAPLTAMSTQMSAGPNMMPAPASPSTQFSPYDASGTFMEMSQPDSNRMLVDLYKGTGRDMPTMPATDVDAPFARRMDGMAIDAPADFFPTADGAVMAGSPEADEAAYQQWLSTEGSSKLIQQWDKTNPGFSRRMYDTAKRIKAGKF